MTVYQAVVVGAGINGLATCYHLLRSGLSRVALVEQYQLAHSRGSSHGHSRITRSTYHAPHYVDLVRLAHKEAWPELQEEAGERLLTPCLGCFFGPGLGVYLDSMSQVPEVADQLEVLSAAQARTRVRAFRFEDSRQVVLDHSAAVVAAQRTIACLIRLCQARQATILENCRVSRLDLERDPLVLHTNQGELSCERLVVTAGPWTVGLVGECDPHLRVARQHVGYFRLQAAAEDHLPGRFPVWVYTREGGGLPGETYYGLPEFGRPGVKLARHVTGLHPETGQRDDPEAGVERMPSESREDLLEFARAQLSWPVAEVVGTEVCYYTNTAGEDFILDTHPRDPRVVIGAGFSGHGFKFGPLTGRILAQLSLEGVTRIEEFERHRDRFRVANSPCW